MKAGRVFLSFAHDDRRAAEALASALQARNVEVWTSDDLMEPGEGIATMLRNLITDSDALVLILSEGSINSPGVLFEAGAAMGQEKNVIAISLSPQASRRLPLGFEEIMRIAAGNKGPAEIADKVVDALHADPESPRRAKSTRLEEVHVKPRTKGGWAVVKSGAKRASSVHDLKVDAVRAARKTAQRHRGELIIHNAQGRIAQKDSYAPTPRRRTT